MNKIKFKTSSMIKDALDNLPGGVCFFDKRGIPILVNRTMHKLIFMLKGHDIQDISDIDDLINAPKELSLGDGTIWQFQRKIADEKRGVIEITASDITELTKQKAKLEEGNAEQRKVMEHLEKISQNVVEITRNEEILEMKMKIHSELGFALSATRHFIVSELSAAEKRDYIEKQREMAGKLLLQTDNDDEPDIFSELKTSAKKLGMEIVCDGEIPGNLEGIMTKVVRECLINAMRHGNGDKVFVECEKADGRFIAKIRDNGQSPGTENVSEGGGLSSIRKGVEEFGGSMRIETEPEFAVMVEFRM